MRWGLKRCCITIIALGVALLPHGAVGASASSLSGENGSAVSAPQPDFLPGDITTGETLSVTIGYSRLLKFEGLLRVAVGDPKVADVAVVSDKELVLNGRSPGQTTLHVWDKAGVHFYRVEVDRGNAGIVDEVSRLIGLDGISVRMANETILLEGTVSKPEDKPSG